MLAVYSRRLVCGPAWSATARTGAVNSVFRKAFLSAGPIPEEPAANAAASAEKPEEDDKYNPQPPEGLVPSFAYNLNFSFVNYPLTSIVTMPVIDMMSIATTYSLVWMSGINASPELAVAVAISRLLRRFRLPLELANAALLIKMFPPLSRVNVVALADVVPGMNMFTPKSDTRFGRSVKMVVDKVNECGIGYFLSARFTGVAITTLIFTAMRIGVDIDPLLNMLGTHKDQLGHVLGTYAMALLLSSTLYPLALTATGIIVPRVGRTVEAPFREAVLVAQKKRDANK